MSNIKQAFTNGKAFIAFITCGDPDLDTTAKTIRAAVENGADLIELGIPFSDPTAEGPVIQGANIRALEGGITTDKVFDFVKELRRDVKIPLVFMTYANVVFSYGAERFMKRCSELSVDGIIIPDIPYEEKGEFSDVAKQYGIDMISSVAPNSTVRAEMIAKDAEGFISIVPGQGASENLVEELAVTVEHVRKVSDIPCVVGFGISRTEKASAMGAISDGVVARTAMVKLMKKHGKDSAKYVGEFVKSMKEAVNK